MATAGLQRRLWFAWINFKRWSLDGIALWSFIGILIILYLITYNFPIEKLFPASFKERPAYFADRVRWFGILSEVVAIGMIAWQLSRSLAAFKKPQLITRFFSWIAEFRFVVMRRPPINLRMETLLDNATLIATATVTQPSGGTVEKKIERLEKSVAAIQESLSRVSGRVEILDRDTTKRFEEEIKQRHLTEKRFDETIEQQIIGDVHFQMAGLALLVLSIFMANASTEASLFLQFLGLGHRAYW